jgi:hypothetical protein
MLLLSLLYLLLLLLLLLLVIVCKSKYDWCLNWMDFLILQSFSLFFLSIICTWEQSRIGRRSSSFYNSNNDNNVTTVSHLINKAPRCCDVVIAPSLSLSRRDVFFLHHKMKRTNRRKRLFLTEGVGVDSHRSFIVSFASL